MFVWGEDAVYQSAQHPRFCSVSSIINFLNSTLVSKSIVSHNTIATMKFQQVAIAALFAGAIAAPSQGKGKDDYSVDKNYQTNDKGDVVFCKGGWEIAQKADSGSAGKVSAHSYDRRTLGILSKLKEELAKLKEERKKAKADLDKKKKVRRPSH